MVRQEMAYLKNYLGDPRNISPLGSRKRWCTMKENNILKLILVWFLVFLIAVPQWSMAQDKKGSKPFKQEELEQMLAPIALYPDSLMVQVLMASTYPLEIVKADRWVKQNKDLKGNALTTALEKESWDPSVKSLVNFPQVLAMMSDKVDWTQKVGDAFLAQQKDVMDTIQKLRKKAQASGNLKTTKEQKVTVVKETQVIVIEPANPQVIYVPVYDPVVVYGVWAYPAYPPYPVYPPGYTAAVAFTFAAVVVVGVAWGYAWGHCHWGGAHGYSCVNINVHQNINVNRNINRNAYAKQYPAGKGNWQHDPGHRGGVNYRDQGTRDKYNKPSTQPANSRDSYRGRSDQGSKDKDKDRSGSNTGDRGKQDASQKDKDRSGSNAGDRGKQNTSQKDRDRSGSNTGDRGKQDLTQKDRGSSGAGAADRGSSNRGGDNAFSGSSRGGDAKQYSDRGSSSRQGMSSGGGRSYGGGGGRGGGRR